MISGGCIKAVRAFNRTIVELKLGIAAAAVGVLVAFNRTIVELKHRASYPHFN